VDKISLTPVPQAGVPKAVPSTSPLDAVEGFRQVLDQAIQATNSRMEEANELARGLVAGEHARIHEVMIASEKAGISFRLMTKMQQKVIDAYKEIMRLQL